MEKKFSYEPIPQLQDVDFVMRQYAEQTVNAILSDANNFDIVIPLNGSIAPLYYLYCHLVEHHPAQVDTFSERVRFMQDVKDSSGMIALLFDHENSQDGAYVIDDIADELHVADAMTDIYPQLSIFAPVQKNHTRAYLTQLPDAKHVNLLTTTNTENKWIASSCGMNEGAHADQNYKKALLSTLQRFARAGFFKDPSNSLTPEEKIHFFQNQLLPQFDETDPLFVLNFELEVLKNNRQYENMIHLSQRIIPTILTKIRLQNSKVTASQPLRASGINP